MTKGLLAGFLIGFWGVFILISYTGISESVEMTCVRAAVTVCVGLASFLGRDRRFI